MAAKKESAKESVEKLDKAIAYKSEALKCAIDNAFSNLRDISDSISKSVNDLNDIISKIKGIDELEKSIKQSIDLKASYQNVKELNGSKAKVPEIPKEILMLGLEIHDAPECTENSDPESIFHGWTKGTNGFKDLDNPSVGLPDVIMEVKRINTQLSSMNKNINMLFESYDSLSTNVRGSNLRLNRIEQALYNLSPRLKKKMKLFETPACDEIEKSHAPSSNPPVIKSHNGW